MNSSSPVHEIATLTARKVDVDQRNPCAAQTFNCIRPARLTYGGVHRFKTATG